nr:MAG TPA: hypothetical protein [Caudoviricetes sp.]
MVKRALPNHQGVARVKTYNAHFFFLKKILSTI